MDEAERVKLQIKIRGLEFKIVELSKEIFRLESRALAEHRGYRKAQKALQAARIEFTRAMNASREVFLRAAAALSADEQTKRALRDVFCRTFVFRSEEGIAGGARGDVLIESTAQKGVFRAMREGICVTFSVEESGRVSILRVAETDEMGNELRILYPLRA
ncbi:MAG: hypothetical protein QXG98_05850 [Candidatus Micrarchaeia archaeon]